MEEINWLVVITYSAVLFGVLMIVCIISKELDKRKAEKRDTDWRILIARLIGFFFAILPLVIFTFFYLKEKSGKESVLPFFSNNVFQSILVVLVMIISSALIYIICLSKIDKDKVENYSKAFVCEISFSTITFGIICWFYLNSSELFFTYLLLLLGKLFWFSEDITEIEEKSNGKKKNYFCHKWDEIRLHFKALKKIQYWGAMIIADLILIGGLAFCTVLQKEISSTGIALLRSTAIVFVFWSFVMLLIDKKKAKDEGVK